MNPTSACYKLANKKFRRNVSSFFSHDLGRTTKDGDTVLHLCSRSNKTECMKLLLRVCPELCEIENADGETALDIARSMNYDLCVELASISL